VPILVAHDRSAGEADFVFEHFTLKNVEQQLLPRLSQDIVLCTDGHLIFEAFTAKHQFVNNLRTEMEEDGDVSSTTGADHREVASSDLTLSVGTTHFWYSPGTSQCDEYIVNK
jgi:hypothetical protein